MGIVRGCRWGVGEIFEAADGQVQWRMLEGYVESCCGSIDGSMVFGVTVYEWVGSNFQVAF